MLCSILFMSVHPRYHQSPRRPSASGHVLVEIIAVLTVLAVLAALLTRGTWIETRVVNESALLALHLRYAQARAMGDTVAWGMEIAGASYTLRRDGAVAAVNLPGEASAARSFPSGVSATALTIAFSPGRGIPLDMDGDPVAENQIIRVTGDSVATVTVTRSTGFIP